MMIYDQLCLRHDEAGHLSLLKLEGLHSKVWSVNQDYSRLHTVKFTKLANMITLKRLLIVQSQKLVTAHTRPQVRIVSSNFSDNYHIKRNTTMNVNKSQKHGPILHSYHSSKIKDHKNNCNASYTNPFQLKIC